MAVVPPHDVVDVPRYDPAIDAWVLSRFADVSSVLSDVRLSAGGDDQRAHVAVRHAAHRAFSADRIAEWRGEMQESARDYVTKLSASGDVDLVRDFAAPFSLALAAMATGAPSGELPRLANLARTIFLSAAATTDGETTAEAKAAAAELSRAFPARDQATVDVQAFVALSHTLPCFLGAAWLTLFQQPQAVERLRADGTLIDEAVEELLRLAGPSRAVFRRAIDDVEFGGAHIAKGARLALLLAAANRDPARFANPERFCFGRPDTGHLAFSRGGHFCSGAALIRSAVATATRALVDTRIDFAVRSATWIDGFAIRGVESLLVSPRGA